jgi:CbiX
VMEDIPAQIAAVHERLAIGPVVLDSAIDLGAIDLGSIDVGANEAAYPQLSVMPFLGDWPTMGLALLDDLMEPAGLDSVNLDEDAVMVGRITHRVLLAHGSRLPGSMESLESIAQTLRMATAYWLIEPKLEPCLDALITGGCNVIEIYPYFLFEGGISDGIDRLIQGVSKRYPQVEFVMHDVLAARPDFVAMLGQEFLRFVGNNDLDDSVGVEIQASQG